MRTDFTSLNIQPVTPRLWFSDLYGPAQITHCAVLSPHSPNQSCSIPKQVMYIQLGPASQYFSTPLRAPPNLNPFEHNIDTSMLFPTVIKIAKSFPFLESRPSSS